MSETPPNPTCLACGEEVLIQSDNGGGPSRPLIVRGTIAPCYACMRSKSIEKVPVIHTVEECLNPEVENFRLGYWAFHWFGYWVCPGCYDDKAWNDDVSTPIKWQQEL